MLRKLLCMLILAAMLLNMPLFPDAHAENQQSLYQIMQQSCLNNQQVDISAFALNEDSLDAAYCALQYSGALPWYVSSYQYTYSDSTILTFSPIYYDEAQYDYARYEQAVAELLHEAVFDGMSQWQMALAVHDALIANSIYDESLEKNTSYDILVNSTGVCAGYAMAYLDIMTRLGIQCRFVVSDEMNHAWNLVKIDGNWYHVDLTWDDPAPDSYGMVRHEYFLLTDAQMLEKEHYGWDTDITCTDTRFTDSFWRNVDSRIIYTDANHCFLRVQKDWVSYIYAREETSGKQTKLHAMQPQYINLGNGSYAYEHNGLSVWNGRLWFSSTTAVYSMLPDGTDLQTVYRYDATGNQKFIYGSYVSAGTLFLTLSNSQYNRTSQTIALEVTADHKHSYTSQTIDPTCTETGCILHSCPCGIQYETDTTPALEHAYESIVIQNATCTQEGRLLYTCSRCSHSYADSYLDPEVHEYTSEISYEATLFRDGVSRLCCIHCGHVSREPLPRLTLLQWAKNDPLAAAVVSGCVIGFVLLRSATRKRKEQ